MDYPAVEWSGPVDMSAKRDHLSVLLSCPSDLNAEKKVIEEAIGELNPLLAQAYNVMLDPISWNTSLIPGVGSDPQAVINSQLNGKIDIYLGLLGARFGSETPRAGSGTAEEFDSAYEKYRAAPESIRILFYFKSSVESIHRVDPSELSKVIAFRGKLGNAGVFYHEFPDSDALLKVVADHLRTLVAEQWDATHSKWKVISPITSAIAVSSAQVVNQQSSVTEQITRAADIVVGVHDDEDGPEFFDLVVLGHAAVADTLKSLSQLGEMNRIINEQLVAKTLELQRANKDAGRVKVIMDAIADDLNLFAQNAQRESGQLKNGMLATLDAMETLLRMYFDEKLGNPNELRETPCQIESLSVGISNARRSVDFFRESLEQLPRFTARFRNAKNRAAGVLGEISAMMTIFLAKLSNIQSEMRTKMPNGAQD
ncbi:MAG TPA: hypothetical protein VGL89_13090 [Candidatus Koribacter sp.]